MLFLDEILTTPRSRFCFTGIDGLFDGSHMTTSETGDLLVQSHVSWTRKLMLAALRAFTCSSGEKSGHLHKSIYRGDRCTSKRGILTKASRGAPARGHCGHSFGVRGQCSLFFRPRQPPPVGRRLPSNISPRF